MADMTVTHQRKVDLYVTIDLITFIISILLLGINYGETNNSFFTTVFILMISPCLRKLSSFLVKDMRLLNKKVYKWTNIIEMVLMGVISVICFLGILGIIVTNAVYVEEELIIRVCVVEGYVFFAGTGFDLRICMGMLYLIMGLKLFNSFSEGIVIQ